MTQTVAKPKARPGPKPKYRDDAERQAAHQERLRVAAAEAEMLRTVINTPTPEFLFRTGARAMKWALAKDKDLAGYAADLVAALLAGIEEEAGQNVSQAVVNSLLTNFRKETKPHNPLPAPSETWNLV